MPEDDERLSLAPSRRGLLHGAVGLGGLALLPASHALEFDVTDETYAAAAEADPHTVATYRAVVDAMLPRTPGVAADRGDVHEPGGLAVEVERFLIAAFNTYFPTTPVTEDLNARGAELVAALLDGAASDLLASGANESEPDPSRFPAGGPFAALTRRDRFRAIDRIERGAYDPDPSSTDVEVVDLLTDSPGAARFAMVGLNSFTVVGYYTEWAGYGETKDDAPTDREFTGDVLSWEQTDFPGPARGYAALRGYEVEAFREGSY